MPFEGLRRPPPQTTGIGPRSSLASAFDVSLEGRELLHRVRLELVEPALDRCDRLRPQPKHPRPSVLWWALVGDDSRLEQDAEVPAHGRCRGARCRCELAGAKRAAAQKLDHLLTSLVG